MEELKEGTQRREERSVERTCREIRSASQRHWVKESKVWDG